MDENLTRIYTLWDKENKYFTYKIKFYNLPIWDFSGKFLLQNSDCYATFGVLFRTTTKRLM